MTQPKLKEKRTEDRHIIAGSLPVKIISVKGARELLCQAIDLSSSGLGLTSYEKLNIGDEVKIQFKVECLNLKVIWRNSYEDIRNNTYYRYGLITSKPGLNLFKFFNTIKEVKIFSHSNDSWKITHNHKKLKAIQIRAMRFEINGDLTGKVQLKQSNDTYEILIKNFSRTGFLLFTKNKSFSLPMKQFIELEIKPENKFLYSSITCVAKVVRQQTVTIDSHTKEEYPAFGVQIIHIMPEDMENWFGLISRMEENKL